VEDSVRVFLGHLGEGLELFGADVPERDLDALHAGGIPDRLGAFGKVAAGVGEATHLSSIVALAVVVTLAIDALSQARFGEELLLELAREPELDLLLEDVDVASEAFGDPIGQHVSPGTRGHGSPPRGFSSLVEIFPIGQVENISFSWMCILLLVNKHDFRGVDHVFDRVRGGR
jgi:hypothetical protein